MSGNFYHNWDTAQSYSMRHSEDRTKRVTITRHNKGLKKGTSANILKQAGLTIEEFKELL